MMFFRVFIVAVTFCASHQVNGAIVGSPTKLHVNNIYKNEHIKNSNINATFKLANNEHPEQSIIATNDKMTNGLSKKLRTPMQISLPTLFNKNNSTQIKHLFSRNMPDPAIQTAHPKHLEDKPFQNILKQEVPKPQKKLYHHLTIEELRQRRKELREKWLARHNRFAHDATLGLYNKNEDLMRFGSKHTTMAQTLKPEVSKSTLKELIKKKMHVDSTHPDHIANIYEQVTPRTRRILEHKDDSELLHSTRYKQLISARLKSAIPSSTISVIRKTTEHSKSKEKLDLSKHKESTTSKDHSNEEQSSKESTESQSNENDIGFLVNLDPRKTSTSTETVSSTLSTRESTVSSSKFSSPTKANQEIMVKSTESILNNPTPDKHSISTSTSSPEKGSTKRMEQISEPEKKMNNSPSSRQSGVVPFGLSPLVNQLFNPLPITPADSTTSAPILAAINPNKMNPSMNARQSGVGELMPFGLESFGNDGLYPLPIFNIKPDPSTTSSPNLGAANSIDGNAELENEIDTPKNARQGDFRPFSLGNEAFNPIPLFDINPFSSSTSSPRLGSVNSANEIQSLLDSAKVSSTSTESKQRSVAQKMVTITSKPSTDEVVSVKIDPANFDVEVYTVKIDTPPYYRNMTFEEKFLHKKPIHIYGKSAEKEEVSEESVEKNVQNNIHSQVRHGKRSSEHTTGSPEGSAMKISNIHHDWRENLRRAIRERLRKLTSESEEQQLL